MNRIVCIVGPTASGKTALAAALAGELGGEVVSCDSMQVYRRMDIGTAKPTRAQMLGVTHHMLSVAEPWEDFSVSRYCAMATPIVDDILARGKTAVIAGGTGLYIDALIRGGDFAPCPSTGRREELEALAAREGIEAVRERLRAVDPESAQRIPPGDRKRIVRALEVYLETGETITQHDRRTRARAPRYAPVWLSIADDNRADLYARIDRRVDAMLAAGLLDEIRALLDEGVPRKCTAMQAIGYKEFIEALDGSCTLDEAADRVRQATRRYAKRQLTWFRRNPSIHYLSRTPDFSRLVSCARQILREIDT